MGALLRVENVHAYYGNIHALKGINLHVDEGEIVSLIGGNGAGKNNHTAHNLRVDASPAGQRTLQ